MSAPGAVDDADAFAAFVAGLPPAAAELVRAADAEIRRLDPEVVQVLWAHQRTVGYGVGPRKLSEHYAYLDVYDRHVNLGFNHGAALADPYGLLAGSGARFRRTTLRSPADLTRPGIAELLTAARAERAAAPGT